MSLLKDCLGRAVRMGAERVEIEHRREHVTAFRGAIGVGVGGVESSQSATVLEEPKALRKMKRLVTRGKTHRLTFATYESWRPSSSIPSPGSGSRRPSTSGRERKRPASSRNGADAEAASGFWGERLRRFVLGQGVRHLEG
jgi:hypothetical protein